MPKHSTKRFAAALAFSLSVVLGTTAVVPVAHALPAEIGSLEDVLRSEDIIGRGANYQVVAPVRLKGTLLEYQLQTNYGRFTVRGTAELRKRIQEMGAVQQLEHTDWAENAGEGVVDAVTRPIGFLGNLVTKPGETISNSVERAGKMVGGVATSFTQSSTDKSPPSGSDESAGEKVAAAVVGREKARRRIAVELGVDPYTEFQPISDKLDEAAWAFASSSTAVRVATFFIPGGVGAVVTGAYATSGIGLMLVESPTVADETMRRSLMSLGISKETAHRFVTMPAMTRGEKAIFVGALHTLGKRDTTAEQINLFLSSNPNPDAANYMVMSLLMAAQYDKHEAPLKSLKMEHGVPVGVTAAGKRIAFVAADRVGFSDRQIQDADYLIKQMAASAHEGQVELRVLGLASSKLHELSWNSGAFIRERAPLIKVPELTLE
ncbi:hypothetical protein E1162_04805 [Rhodobacteraceae bacterium RKSG542]|uniref:hypothetical protein n=1 Tax=Pseudovibrio flavus TaxID=2529854 RepID=UPI0012BBA1A8|nr:hypothetical protein [Pseudovibrio flavus]MTI16557.1 hypothetical protein [Pseudovibrio flavus]